MIVKFNGKQNILKNSHSARLHDCPFCSLRYRKALAACGWSVLFIYFNSFCYIDFLFVLFTFVMRNVFKSNPILSVCLLSSLVTGKMKVFKNKTRKGKRVLEDRAPKVCFLSFDPPILLTERSFCRQVHSEITK